jgi:hypothetical protein
METGVPGSWGLLKTVDRFVELANIVRSGWILKSWGLLHVCCLIKKAMEEGVTDVNLTEMPASGHSEREHKSDCGRLDHRREGL